MMSGIVTTSISSEDIAYGMALQPAVLSPNADGSPDVTLDATNEAPEAVDDAYTIPEDAILRPAAPGVLANDTDEEGAALSATLISGPSHASHFTLFPNGAFDYIPSANYNGPDSFSYRASDGTSFGNIATVNITVEPVNDAPVANQDIYSTDEDTPLTVTTPGVLANDYDIEGQPLTAVLFIRPAHGQLSLNSNGSFTYTPNTDFHGVDSFLYWASDGLPSRIETVYLTVNPLDDDAPVAVDDSYSVEEDGFLEIGAPGVISNDTDADGDTLIVTLVGSPSHGELSLSSDGSFTYRPNGNFNGSDSFVYEAMDDNGNSSEATVHLTVNAVNDAPEAANDSYSIDEDGTLTIDALAGVLGNDTDGDGDMLNASLLEGPANGALTLNADGSLTYTPDADFNGEDSFTYRVDDGTVDGNVATVNLTVNAVNDAPAGTADGYSTEARFPLVVAAEGGVLANDRDAEGQATTAVPETGPSHGNLSLNADGSFTYAAHAGFYGTDTFSYRATDGELSSDPVEVAIDVERTPGIIVTSNESTSDVAMDVTVQADGKILVAGSSSGSFALARYHSSGMLDASFGGDGTVTTSIGISSASGTSVALLPDGKVAVAGYAYNGSNYDFALARYNGDGSLDIGFDGDGIVITPVGFSADLANSVTTQPDGKILVAGYTDNGSDYDFALLRYNADGSLDTSFDGDGIVTTSVGISYEYGNSVALQADGKIVVAGASVDGSDYSFALARYNADGSLDTSFSGDGKVITATGPYGDVGTSVAAQLDGKILVAGYAANDGSGYDFALVRYNADGLLDTGFDGDGIVTTPVGPSGDGGYSVALQEDGKILVAGYTLNNSQADFALVRYNADGSLDTSFDGDGITSTGIGVASSDFGWSVALQPDGKIVVAGYTTNGFDSDVVVVRYNSDGSLDETFDGENLAAPAAVDDFYSVDEDGMLTVDALEGVLVNDTDGDGDALSAAPISGPAHGALTLNADGSFTYNPEADFFGYDSFTYRVNDGTVDGGTATVNLTVDAVNDAPVGVADSYSTAAGVPLIVMDTAGVLANDSDVDDPFVYAELVSGPSRGELTIGSDGAFTYVADAGFYGTDTFSYRATDGGLNSDTVAVTIEVTGEPLGAAVRLEAEAFDSLGQFFAESVSGASEEGVIRLASRQSGTASTSLTNAGITAGLYDVTVAFLDENDSIISASLWVDGAQAGAWAFDAATPGNGKQIGNLRTLTFGGVAVDADSTLELRAGADNLEFARIDYVEFAPLPAGAVRLEAEAFDSLGQFFAESVGGASGEEVIRLASRQSGAASTSLTDAGVAEGRYDVTVAFLDENDSVVQASLWVDGVEAGSWAFDAATPGNGKQIDNLRTVTFNGVDVGVGSTLELRAAASSLEFARIDYVQLVPSSTDGPVRIEAEEFDNLGHFFAESVSGASEQEIVRLASRQSGVASTSLTDAGVEEGTYDVTVAFLDENDSVIHASLWVDGVEIGDWDFDAATPGNGKQIGNLRTLTFEDIAIDADATLEIRAVSDNLEFARIDYVEFNLAVDGLFA